MLDYQPRDTVVRQFGQALTLQMINRLRHAVREFFRTTLPKRTRGLKFELRACVRACAGVNLTRFDGNEHPGRKVSASGAALPGAATVANTFSAVCSGEVYRAG
jgi:hypothetical protein